MRRTTHVVEDVAEADSILDTGREHLEVVPIMVVSLLLCHLHFLWLQTHPVFTTHKRLHMVRSHCKNRAPLRAEQLAFGDHQPTKGESRWPAALVRWGPILIVGHAQTRGGRSSRRGLPPYLLVHPWPERGSASWQLRYERVTGAVGGGAVETQQSRYGRPGVVMFALTVVFCYLPALKEPGKQQDRDQHQDNYHQDVNQVARPHVSLLPIILL